MIDPSRLKFCNAQPALHLVPSKNADSASRWGGAPSLPVGDGWPHRADGTPLSFLGQVDLAQSQAMLKLDYLPDDGLLLFFYDSQNQPWGFDPDDRDGWKIVYVPTGTQLVPSVLEHDVEAWNPSPIEFRLIETYEDGCPSTGEGVEMTDEDTDAIMEFVSDRNYAGQPHHQMGGYPEPIQNPGMENECELASHQVNAGSAEGYNGSRGKELLKAGGAKDWRLVLQVDSDDDLGRPGWMWGDSGMLYFWVKKEAGRMGDFSNAWLVLQCC